MRTLAIAMIGAASLFAADSPDLGQAQIDDIIQKFAAKEAAFARARENYTYRQTARIQTLDQGGNQTGRWEQVSDIIFSTDGKRSERVVRAPMDTLRDLILTPQDMQDLKDVQPFVLTTNELPKYYIRYLGKETLDEIPCYVFAVKPKKLEPGQRYFQGQVWVDDRDLQIVKSYGRGIGQLKKNEDQQFPKFETYREQIDGKYWFPTYTIANDTLHFASGQDVRIRQTVRYEDYKQFKADTTITFGDTVEDKKEPAPPKK
jgi:hypothetical protein